MSKLCAKGHSNDILDNPANDTLDNPWLRKTKIEQEQWVYN
jgi:hypothetical protein